MVGGVYLQSGHTTQFRGPRIGVEAVVGVKGYEPGLDSSFCRDSSHLGHLVGAGRSQTCIKESKVFF